MIGAIEKSAADDVPSFLLSFSANAGPAVLLVGQQVSGALDIGDDVRSFSLKSSSACSHGSFNFNRTFNLKFFSALFSRPGSNNFGHFDCQSGLVDRVEGSEKSESGGNNNSCLGHRNSNQKYYTINKCCYTFIELIVKLIE